MAKRRTDDPTLAALDRLADPTAPAADASLRAALKSGGSLAVARAAELVRQHRRRGFEPDLLAAFARFLTNDGEAAHLLDPQCRAKTAVVEALGTLEHRDSDFFLTHIGLTQPEPVWGGSVDAAAQLRGLCGWGLVQSGHPRALPHLIDLLADPEKNARRGAVQAIGLVGSEAAALVLRTKLTCGDAACEVLGDACETLLALTPVEGVPFVARFLDHADPDVRLEAAAALGGSPKPEATAALIAAAEREGNEEQLASLLLAIGAGRRPEGIDYLLPLVAEAAPRLAGQALTALAPCRFCPGLRERIGATVASRGHDGLRRQFAREIDRP